MERGNPGLLVRRGLLNPAQEALGAFRVVVLNGPRQSGKSTLLRQLHKSTGGLHYDLDDETLWQAALADPSSLVSGQARHVYVDEVQRGGDALVRAIKRRVDDPRSSTVFVLAGSTNFLTVPTLAESLAGRAVFLEVWPFSQGELRGAADRFLTRCIASPETLRRARAAALPREEYFKRIVAGGYPEPLRLPVGRLRTAWFKSYVTTVTQRDVRDISRIRWAGELPRLLRYLAGKTAQPLVKIKLADEVGIERNTLAGYLPLLETVFLVRELPAWSRNPLGKVTHTPKTHMCDTGLAAHLLGLDAAALAAPVAPMRGQLVETFVHNELMRQRAWSDVDVEFFHWRDRDGAEVDMLVETSAGAVFGIECKAASTVVAADFRWLRRLDAKLGSAFRHGIVLYLGEHPLAFGPKLTALPLSSLWS
jgi:uncharacterized protein